MNWNQVQQGMSAARSVPDVGNQATALEAQEASGVDFFGQDSGGNSPDWQYGYDHAILLARGK